jgi:hypothetical protein
VPVDEDPRVDQLSSPPRSPRRLLLLTAAAVAVAAVVAVALAGHRERRHPSAEPTPTSTTALTVADSPGVVFLHHLDRCTTTDHRRLLRIAFGVTNLSDRTLHLLHATPILSNAALRLTAVQFGRPPCAAGGSTRPVRLGGAGTVVVALTFRIAELCPKNTEVAARVTFGSGADVLHADSSELADLGRLTFAQC